MRRRTENDDSTPELNLAPIMNMVVILIPLLLLSVVFLSVGVINVNSPTFGPLPATDVEKKPPLNLALAISEDGFTVSTEVGVAPPASECASGGPTICLTGEDPTAHFDEARAASKRGELAAATAALEQGAAAYDWPALYERLREIKAEHPDETTVKITADPDIPYAMVVRTMDLARFELEGGTITSDERLWAAKKRRPLFPDPVLAIAR